LVNPFTTGANDMAESYRFHAYSPQRKDPGRRLRAKARQTLVESEQAPGHLAGAPLHYGRKFAETEDRSQERASQERGSEERGSEGWSRRGRGAPIGALPPTEETEQRPEAQLDGASPPLNALVSEAMRNVEALTTAIRDVGGSSLRLARFPWDAARALRRRHKP
jgi:hypothetical protein